MANSDFVHQYTKKFAESVQNNEEAISEFKRMISASDAVPIKIAMDLLRKYSGDMNSFFQAPPLKDINVGYQGDILGKVGSIRCIEYERDGNKRIRCVGILEDKSGKLPFTEFPDGSSRLSRGDLVLIKNASVGNYNNRPYLTIYSRLEINILEKSNQRSAAGENLKVRDLKPDMYDVTIRGSLRPLRSRENVGKDSVTLYSGILTDSTGTVSVQSWGTPLPDGTVEITGASVKQFKDRLYLQIGKGTRVSVISKEDGHFTNLEQLSNSQSGNASGIALVLKAIEKNYVVQVCSSCQRVVREGKCQNHPDAPIERIIRMTLLVDDGYLSPLVYAYQKVLERYVDGGKEAIKQALASGKENEIVDELRRRLTMRLVKYSIHGFRGTSGTYMEFLDLVILDDDALEREYKETMEALK